MRDIHKGNTDGLAQLHALSSGLKATITWEMCQGIEQCRLSCGGHGYLLVRPDLLSPLLSGGEASEFGGGGEPICSADLHPPPPLPPLSALLPTSSLNYRPLTFDWGGGAGPLIFVGGGGGHGPQTQYGSALLPLLLTTSSLVPGLRTPRVVRAGGGRLYLRGRQHRPSASGSSRFLVLLLAILSWSARELWQQGPSIQGGFWFAHGAGYR